MVPVTLFPRTASNCVAAAKAGNTPSSTAFAAGAAGADIADDEAHHGHGIKNKFAWPN